MGWLPHPDKHGFQVWILTEGDVGLAPFADFTDLRIEPLTLEMRIKVFRQIPSMERKIPIKLLRHLLEPPLFGNPRELREFFDICEADLAPYSSFAEMERGANK